MALRIQTSPSVRRELRRSRVVVGVGESESGRDRPVDLDVAGRKGGLEGEGRRRMTSLTPVAGAPGLDEGQISVLVDGWVADGVVDAGVATRVRTDLAALARPAERLSRAGGSVAVEALGYLGGAVVVVGASAMATQYWGDLDPAWRFAAVAATGTLLLLAGVAAPVGRGAAFGRLRSVLWLASTVAAGGALVLLTDDLVGLGERDVVLALGAGTTTYAAALWVVDRAAVQQVAMVTAGAVTAAAAINRVDPGPDLPGLGVWAVGLGWAILGSAGVLAPRRMVLALGAAMAIFGGMLTGGSEAGMVLTLVTIAAAVTVAVRLGELAVLAVAALGALVNIPAAMTRWFPDSIAGAFGLVLAGLALVAAALWIARRHASPPAAEPPTSPRSRS